MRELARSSAQQKRGKRKKTETRKDSRFDLGLVTLESIPTIPFCCFPIVSTFQLEGYSKEYLFRSVWVVCSELLKRKEEEEEKKRE